MGDSMQVLRFSDLIEVPWKNGGGITREIAKGMIGEGIAWRISRADVGEDGAFSDFAGLMRILTIVSGGTMQLEHAGGVILADLWNPVRFDGGLPIFARLMAGPLSDLNLMFDPQRVEATVETLRGPFTAEGSAAGICVVHGLEGRVQVGDQTVHPGDSAFLTGETISAAPGSAALVMRLTYRADIRLCIASR